MKYLISLILFSTMFMGCLGTEVGNPEKENQDGVEIDFVPLDRQKVLIGGLSLSNNIEIDSAELVIDSIRFEKCEGQAEPKEVMINTPFVVDLFNEGKVDAHILLPEGKYCKLDIKSAKATSELEDSHVGFSVFAKGSYKGTPLEIQYSGQPEIKLQGALKIDPKTNRIFIVIDIEKWFAGLDLSKAKVVDDKIVLGAEGNTDLLEGVGKNFKRSVNAVTDKDHDEKLDYKELFGDDDDNNEREDDD